MKKIFFIFFFINTNCNNKVLFKPMDDQSRDNLNEIIPLLNEKLNCNNKNIFEVSDKGNIKVFFSPQDIQYINFNENRNVLGYFDPEDDAIYWQHYEKDYLDKDKYIHYRDEAQSIIIHELGHAFGLQHNNLDFGSIMYPDLIVAFTLDVAVTSLINEYKSQTNQDMCNIFGK